MLKSEITNVPVGCACEVKELPNNVPGSPVRGFVDTYTCPICADLQKKQAEENKKRMEEQKKAQEKEDKLQAKIRELAQAELDKEV
jgi:hypothetical protein